MKIAFWSFYEGNCVDMKMFHEKDHEIAEGIFKKWNILYDECLSNGIELIALDKVDDYNKIDFFVFADFPRMQNPVVKRAFKASSPKILIIEEGPLIHADNWNFDLHALFDYVFTWNDEFVDNIKYFKFNVHSAEGMANNDFSKEKLCVLIARNKRAWGKSELYTERRDIIRYFEKHHPGDFDLFGEGWDMYYFPSNVPILKLFNGSKLFWIRAKMKEHYPSWRGRVSHKKEVISKYRFSIVIENSLGPTGYISEKIWDTFAAGSIPVYLGAPNILDYIPGNCFIDLRNFNNYDELYYYMKSMGDEEYNGYLKNIRMFLQKEISGGVFSDQYFVTAFINLVRGYASVQTSKSEMR